MNGPPFKRVPQRRGDEVLLCRTGPKVIQADGTYFPRWHLAKLAKRKLKAHWGPASPRETLWHFKNPKTGAFDVTRVWAYVPRCGSGHGYPATKLGYGKAPTCKRCLKKVA
jgi:hypothetical protein